MTTGPSGDRPSFVRATGTSAAALVVCALPIFLLGAFGPAIKEEFDISETMFGALFSFGFLVSALTLQLAGEFADRRGARRALRIGIGVAMAGAVLFGLVNGVAMLFVAYGVVRLAEAITQPSTNTLIGGVVPVHRQGRALGFKQAAIPTATGLSGLAVPLFGDSLGWRGSFLLMLVPAGIVWVLLPPVPIRPRALAAKRGDLLKRRYLQLVAVGSMFGAAAISTVGAFLVSGAEDAGFSEGSAGLLFALGAVFLVPARIAWGFLADRRQFNRFAAVGLCFLVASTGFLLFSFESQATIVVGTVVMFALGWSWPGLLLFAVIEQHPNEPGASTALVQTAVRVGALFSPLLFGWIVDNSGYALAWRVAMTSSLIGAAFLAAGAMQLRKETNFVTHSVAPERGV